MTSQAASSTSGRFYLANTHVPKGFHLPGITDDARHALAECLEDDYNHHHVYFNDKKGFHNHLTHHLLAAFSLGAGADRLRAIHALQSRRQLSLKPAHRSGGDHFDPDQHWGDDNYYHDYLDYFTREVEQRDGGDGRRTAERWLFGKEELGRRNQFYARFLGGAYHPFIHLGYGLEYNLNCMIAEGLAQVAVHSPQVAALIAEVDENATPGSKSAKEVALAVAADAALDPVKKFELGSTRLKLTALLAQGGGPIVRAHAAQWACPTDKVYEKAHELQQLAVAVMAGAVRPEKKVVFDFFLMHAVTSSIFLPTYVRSLQPENAARLLRDKLAVDLGHFVSRGRPELNLDQLLTYQPRKPELSGHENAWFGVWDEVLDQAKYQDEHIIKTVRALSYADQHHHDIGFLKQETYAHVALMLLDNVASVNDWEFDGVGFERVWKEWPDRH